MDVKRWGLSVILTLGTLLTAEARDCRNDETFHALRDSMSRAFNTGDSAHFFSAIKNLEDYLLSQDDLHNYYTQRCNEIVFLMNRQKIWEAYKAARQLSKELRERGLDKEMYMAINMMGHIYRYCGNFDAAKKAFREVIALMEKYGYYESMPPIYMNIVNVEMGDDPIEAIEMLNRASEIAKKYSPERVFDIETRRVLSYYNLGDTEKFEEGYKYYKEGVKNGLSSVHGRTIEIYHEAYLGNIDKAIEMARAEMGEQGTDIITNLYKNAGMWKEAYESLRKEKASDDSINNVILSNNMQGIQDEIRIFEMERESAKNRMIGMSAVIVLLLLLIGALTYIVISRRRHERQLKEAYEHALESDNMKTAFIRNINHEVRTPLNIISGFAQVISDPNIDLSVEERQNISQMVLKNTNLITSQFDEMIELSLNENSGEAVKTEDLDVTQALADIINEHKEKVSNGVDLHLHSMLPEGFTTQINKKMLYRMVNILLDNAIKNTTSGYIIVKADADDKHLKITVEDTGCGIAPEEADRIFERFVKLDKFKEGLGLGLTLCKMLAHRIGGDVVLDTTYAGPGARFVISLSKQH
ncbi:tetratricopeptide repeat-containing sensor histidine kinase [Prevotella sp. E15-22]|uniref:tetratricopeptide repeat-containing sensor histidine kinase n=1 Tax=Prevotella sp. E15-22 TaxID=2937774 RepID=UPI00204A3C3E|nr:tetratricopeptide repeat-containing sensor histidine kinase [Prevotella sp. E15-22]UPS43697.1 tetratricopeptide repeat-containing sensor histidine kinase [Prevotella sp. E15-22]